MHSRLALLAAALFVAGCAPDPQLGTFNFNMTGTDTETAPRNMATSVTGNGTFSVTTGKTVDYIVTLSQVDTAPCVLDADLTEKKDAIVITAGQKCTFNYSGGSVTATLTSGSLTGSEKGETAAVNVSYTYAGQVIGINFAGTGTRAYSGSRR
ncbi:MAG: hypothetical protein QM817_27515 [Archangium sp.]